MRSVALHRHSRASFVVAWSIPCGRQVLPAHHRCHRRRAPGAPNQLLRQHHRYARSPRPPLGWRPAHIMLLAGPNMVSMMSGQDLCHIGRHGMPTLERIEQGVEALASTSSSETTSPQVRLLLRRDFCCAITSLCLSPAMSNNAGYIQAIARVGAERENRNGDGFVEPGGGGGGMGLLAGIGRRSLSSEISSGLYIYDLAESTPCVLHNHL